MGVHYCNEYIYVHNKRRRVEKPFLEKAILLDRKVVDRNRNVLESKRAVENGKWDVGQTQDKQRKGIPHSPTTPPITNFLGPVPDPIATYTNTHHNL